jgi:hypothetical protein
LSATDPPPVELSPATDTPSPEPESADSKQDPESPREKRKMKSALDAFLKSG